MKYLKYYESFDETMIFWHGGNLDNIRNDVSNRKDKFELGPGLYLIDHKETALKYKKGSRKLYKVIVNKGVNIDQVLLDEKQCLEFAKKHLMNFDLMSSRIREYSKEGKIKAKLFNNTIINNKLIKPFKTKYLKDFFVKNGIDYDIVENYFGWGEKMMVLYNTDKIKEIVKVNPADYYKENVENKQIWYHGTDEKFTDFKEPNEKNRNVSKLGIWFTNDEGFAESFGPIVMKVKLNFTKPYTISLEKWNDIRSEYFDDSIYFIKLREKLIKKGYDSFFVKGQDDTFAGTKVNTPDVVAVFYKSQIEII